MTFLNTTVATKGLHGISNRSYLCAQVELDEQLLRKVAYVASGDVSPMQAVIGSITAQEVIKVSGSLRKVSPAMFM